MRKLYIAYGSNLNLTQMAYRCPTAVVYAAGILNNWQLIYRGAQANAHATIKRKRGESVPVLVWEIQPADEIRLDRYEGYPVYYYKKDVMVTIDGRRRKAMVYIMDERHGPGRPSAAYVETIRQGYIDNGMDMSAFKRSLEINSIECKQNM